MTHRRELSRRLASLSDIAGILSAMKSVALLETRVLGTFLEAQRRTVAGIEAAAAEFLAWWPESLGRPRDGCELCIVVGSEQGFCGDFNEVLSGRAGTLCAGGEPGGRRVVVGQRLASRLGDDPATALTLPGATVADEVPAVLLRLTTEIGRLLASEDCFGYGLSVIYHCHASGDVRRRCLLPLRDLPPPALGYPYPPELSLTPTRFLSGLTEHYLYAVLNEVLYGSLMAENRHRLAHMDRALDRLGEQTARLRLVWNSERQAEIIEEIEVILLAAGAAPGAGEGEVGG